MLKEEFKISVKGHVTLTDGLGRVLYDDHNDLTGSAPYLLVRALGGNVNQSLSTGLAHIEAGYGAGPSYFAKLISNQITTPAENHITFETTFELDDFVGMIHTLSLRTVDNTIFSEVSGIEIEKFINTTIHVKWKLIFNLV